MPKRGPEHVSESNGQHEPPAKLPKTSKPSAVFQPTGGRDYTVSVALPGSIIANALTHDAKTSLASSIARCAAVFCIDEIVVFNDGTVGSSNQDEAHASADAASGYTAYNDPDHFLAHILSYLETPPHLRRKLFPHHPNLRTAGSMPSLDMPHHLKREEWCRYREGVVMRCSKGSGKVGEHCLVDVGLQDWPRIPGGIPENTRVTVDLEAEEEGTSNGHPGQLVGCAVHPATPREEQGYYWGYQVRQAGSLSAVLTESPFEDGYDYCIGTSERGQALDEFTRQKQRPWKHLMIFFGGVAGLEAAFENDQGLAGKGVKDVSELFDSWIDLAPGQGSRTIRTEEAVWCGCMGLRGWIHEAHSNIDQSSTRGSEKAVKYSNAPEIERNKHKKKKKKHVET